MADNTFDANGLVPASFGGSDEAFGGAAPGIAGRGLEAGPLVSGWGAPPRSAGLPGSGETGGTGGGVPAMQVPEFAPARFDKPAGFGEKLGNTFRGIGQGLAMGVRNIPGHLEGVAEGGQPFASPDSGEWQKAADDRIAAYRQSAEGQRPAFGGTVGDYVGDIAPQVPQMVENLGGAALGARAGSVFGPGGALVGGVLGGLGASLYPAHRETQNRIARQIVETEDQKRQAAGLSPLTLEQKAARANEVQPDVQRYANYEVGTELPGTALETAMALNPWAKAASGIARPIASALSRQALGTGLKTAAKVGVANAIQEPVEETVSQMLQQPIEAKYGLTEEAPRDLSNAGDWLKSAGEVVAPTLRGMAPQMLLGMGMGGVGQVRAGLQTNRMRDGVLGAAANPDLTEPSRDAALKVGDVLTSTDWGQQDQPLLEAVAKLRQGSAKATGLGTKNLMGGDEGDAGMAGGAGKPNAPMPGGGGAPVSPVVPEAVGDNGGAAGEEVTGAPVAAVLPEALKKAATPRLNYGTYKADGASLPGFDLDFENDVDRASYLAATAGSGKLARPYVDFVRQVTGWSPADVREHGLEVKDAATSAADQLVQQGVTDAHSIRVGDLWSEDLAPPSLRLDQEAVAAAADSARASWDSLPEDQRHSVLNSIGVSGNQQTGLAFDQLDAGIQDGLARRRALSLQRAARSAVPKVLPVDEAIERSGGEMPGGLENGQETGAADSGAGSGGGDASVGTDGGLPGGDDRGHDELAGRVAGGVEGTDSEASDPFGVGALNENPEVSPELLGGQPSSAKEKGQAGRFESEAKVPPGEVLKESRNIGGLGVAVVNHAGEVRQYTDDEGNDQSYKLTADAGYLHGAATSGGDLIPVTVKPGTPEDYKGPVYVRDNRNADGTPSRYGVLLGYGDDMARYAAQWDPAKPGGLRQFSMPEFKRWLNDGGLNRPLFAPASKDRPASVQASPEAAAGPTGAVETTAVGGAGLPESAAAKLSPRGEGLLSAVEKGGVMPSMSAALKRIAKEHGLPVSGTTRPDEIVQQLRAIRDRAAASGAVEPVGPEASEGAAAAGEGAAGTVAAGAEAAVSGAPESAVPGGVAGAEQGAVASAGQESVTTAAAVPGVGVAGELFPASFGEQGKGSEGGAVPVDAAAHEAASSPLNEKPMPTAGQIEAGNYAKGHIRVSGLDISVENPKGSERKGVNPSGRAWSVRMQDHYGYIRGVKGADKDHLDVFVKPGTQENSEGPVFVVNQDNADGSFDEHKVLLGYKNEQEAKAAYLRNFEKGWQLNGSLVSMSMPEFKNWIAKGSVKGPVGAGGVVEAEPADKKENNDVSKVERVESEGSGVAALAGGDAAGAGAAAGVSVEPSVLPDGERGAAAAGADREAGAGSGVEAGAVESSGKRPGAGAVERGGSGDGRPETGAVGGGEGEKKSEKEIEPNDQAENSVAAPDEVKPNEQTERNAEPDDDKVKQEPETAAKEVAKEAANEETANGEVSKAEPEAGTTVKPQWEKPDFQVVPLTVTPGFQTVPFSSKDIQFMIEMIEIFDWNLALFDAAYGLPTIHSIPVDAVTLRRDGTFEAQTPDYTVTWFADDKLFLDSGIVVTQIFVRSGQFPYDREAVLAKLKAMLPGAVDWVKPETAVKQELVHKEIARERAALEKDVYDAVVNELLNVPDGKAFREQALNAIDRRLNEAANQEGLPNAQRIGFALAVRNFRERFDEAVLDGMYRKAMKLADAAAKAAKRAAAESMVKPAMESAFNKVFTDVRADTVEDQMAGFYAGFEHALAGGTLSNLPVGSNAVFKDAVQKGYAGALAWLESDDGQLFKVGKVKKIESVGERLKRWSDLQREKREKLAAEGLTTPEGIAAWVDAILDSTVRADLFPIVVGEGSTPGTSRYLEELRNNILPFKRWLATFTYASTRDRLIREISKDPSSVEWIEKRAKEYDEFVRSVAEAVGSPKTVKEAAERLAIFDQKFRRDFSFKEMRYSADLKKKIEDGSYVVKFELLHKPKPFNGKRPFKLFWPVGDQYNLLWSLVSSFEEHENEIILTEQKPSLIRPRLDAVDREGTDWRNGKNVSLEDIAGHFGFQSVTAGDYVTAKQRQDHANYIYDAFNDLAELLKVSPKAMSLGGELHLAIGALGQGKFAAHYQHEHPTESGKTVRVINLTNTRGDGAVAHEWFHALDFSLSEFSRGSHLAKPVFMRKVKSALQYGLTSPDKLKKNIDRFLEGKTTWKGRKRGKAEAAQYLINRARGMLEKLSDGRWPNDEHTGVFYKKWFYRNALELDAGKGKPYWSNDLELFARAGESWVFDNLAGGNNYLVSDWVEEGKVKAPQYRGTPYPADDDRLEFDGLFRNLFDNIQWDKDGKPSLKEGSTLGYFDDQIKESLDFLNRYEQELPSEADLARQAAAEKAERERAAKEARDAETASFIQAALNRSKAETSETAKAEDVVENAETATVPGFSEQYEQAKASGVPLLDTLAGATDADIESLIDSVLSELEESAQEPARTMAEQPYEAKAAALAEKLVPMIESGKTLDWRELFRLADEAFGGSQANGVYTPKDAYDALEVAVNRYLMTRNWGDNGSAWLIDRRLKTLEGLLSRLPAQSKRTDEQQQFQQFSTPPSYALLMGWLADIDSRDVVLEPNAGTGGLIAPWWFRKARLVIANELSARRASLLNLFPFNKVTMENTDHLASILKDVKPTVVVMNPPFSQTAGRLGDKTDIMVGANHVEQALKMLQPGGRLVALVGRGMEPNAKSFQSWWKKIGKNYAVLANVGIDGANYAKYGTRFDTRLLVIDKVSPDGRKTVTGEVKQLSDLIGVLSEVRLSRVRPGQQFAGQQGGVLVAEEGTGGDQLNYVESSATGELGNGGEGADGGRGGYGHGDGGKLSVPAGKPGHGPDEGNGDASGGRSGDGAKSSGRGRAGRGKAGGGKADESVVGGGGTGGSLKADKAAVDRQGQGGPTLAETLAKASALGFEGAEEAIKGLFELFGGNSLKSFPGGIDPDTYAKAKPHFQRSFEVFSAAGDTLENYIRHILSTFSAGIKPYLQLFLSEQQELIKNKDDSTIPDTGKDAQNAGGDVPAGGRTGLGDSVFERYVPSVQFPGAKAHPADLVESAAMATVKLPTITYVPKIPQKLIEAGAPSDAQLEAVALAGQAHSVMLPNKTRRGFLLGDGTGVGKGVEIASIMMDNWQQGRKKAVWITKNPDLFVDAKRDITHLGWDEKLLVNLGDVKGDKPIDLKEGVLFATYGLMRSGMQRNGLGNDEDSGAGAVMAKPAKKRRIDQIVEWLGPDFDGVLVFDEAHAMQNAMPESGGRGKTKVTATAEAGMELQSLLPKARVVYVSATAATKLGSLGYMDRLGLWGDGAPFQSKQDFMTEFGSKNVSALELVANNLKAGGLYLSRSIAFQSDDPLQTVTYGMLTHPVTDFQAETYNAWARAWQMIFTNMDAAMKATGLISDKGEVQNARQRSNALGRFWSTNQRFFNAVLTSMMLPGMIADMRQRLSEGHSVVIQLVNTNEAQQERQAAKQEQNNLDLMDLDVSPRETVMQFLEAAFPIYQYEQKRKSGALVSELVLDSKGDPVINQEALQLRNKIMKELALLPVADNPLDSLIEAFGVNNVAEVTGRKRRRVFETNENGGREARWDDRSKASQAADIKAFEDGEKRILIFSEAGGTGKSYHASKRIKNQQRRFHYLLQPGWRADTAMQGLGRSHRSFQALAPHFMLMTTNIKGHRRFLSSVARRMDMLGALTRGQRQATSQGLFSAEFNLETVYAHHALERLVNDIEAHSFEQDGVIINQALWNKLAIKGVPEVTQFLNRILALELHEQNAVFDAFFERLSEEVEQARSRGTFDLGLENLSADHVGVKFRQVVVEDAAKNVKAEYLELELKTRNTFASFATTMQRAADLGWKVEGFVRQKKSGRIYMVVKAGERTDADTGRIVPLARRVGASGFETMDAAKLVDTNSYGEVLPGLKRSIKEITDIEALAKAWDDGIAELPEWSTRSAHLLTGTLLPIWNKIKDGSSVKIARAETADGQRFLGRRLSAGRNLRNVLRALGIDNQFKDMTARDVYKAVMDEGHAVTLAGDNRLLKSRVSGENRLEFKSPNLRSPGFFAKKMEEAGFVYELIQYQPRLFVPNTKKGLEALDEVLKEYPVIDVGADEDEPESDSLQFSLGAGRVSGVTVADGVSELKKAGFGKVVDGLVKKGLLQVVQSVSELPEGVLEKAKGSMVRGVWVNGRAYLVADHVRRGEWAGVFLHELGEHAGLNEMLGDKLYGDVVSQFKGLVRSGDAVAVAVDDWVNRRLAEGLIAPEDADSERLAYLIERVTNADEARAASSVSGKVRVLVGRILSAIRAWFYQTRAARVLASRGVGLQLSKGDVAALARMAAGQLLGEGVGEADAGAQFGQVNDAPVFYSALTRAVENMKQPKAPGKQWAAMIDKAPGVKQEEVDWSGVREWLGDKASVSKDEVLDYLRGQEVRVEEMDRGDERFNRSSVRKMVEDELYDYLWTTAQEKLVDKEIDDIVSEMISSAEKITNDDGESEWKITWGNETRIIDDDPVELSNEDLLEEFDIDASDILGWVSQENIQKETERLFEDEADWIDKEVDKRIQSAKEDIESNDSFPHAKYGRYQVNGGFDYHELLLTLPDNKRDESVYVSSHWNEKNVLAHVRFNEREDAGGNRVLFVEEVQSDWHQGGRKKGYKKPGYEKLINRLQFLNDKLIFLPVELKTISSTIYELAPEISDKQDHISKLSERNDFVDRHMPEYVKASNSDNLLKTLINKRLETKNRIVSYEKAVLAIKKKLSVNSHNDAVKMVPDAPFKQSWPVLAIKRMIRYAAEHGYDEIAWTPGAVQPGRYPQMGEKEAQGLAKFYDVVLPNEVGKYVKKWGVKPGRKEISGVDAHVLPITPEMRQSVLSEGQPLFSFLGRGAATANRLRLARAEKMEGEGVDAEAIRQKTGWFRGADEKWRFEISDKDATLKIAFKDIPESKPGDAVTLKLGDVLEHPELFKAYPDLADVGFVRYNKNDLSKEEKNAAGWFDVDKNLIAVVASNIDLKSVILHEMQHWIQIKESFARGGNEATAWNLLSGSDQSKIINDWKLPIRNKINEVGQKLIVHSWINQQPNKDIVYEYCRALKAQDEMFEQAIDLENQKPGEPSWDRMSNTSEYKAYEKLKENSEKFMKKIIHDSHEDLSFLNDEFNDENGFKQTYEEYLKQTIKSLAYKYINSGYFPSLDRKQSELEDELSILENKKDERLDVNKIKELVFNSGLLHKYYMRLAGEAEARLVQRRDVLSKQAIKDSSPMNHLNNMLGTEGLGSSDDLLFPFDRNGSGNSANPKFSLGGMEPDAEGVKESGRELGRNLLLLKRAGIDLKRAVNGLSDTAKNVFLSGLTVRMNADLAKDYLPVLLNRFVPAMRNKEAVSAQVREYFADKVAKPFEALYVHDPRQADLVAGLLQDMTVSGVDPTEGFEQMVRRAAAGLGFSDNGKWLESDAFRKSLAGLSPETAKLLRDSARADYERFRQLKADALRVLRKARREGKDPLSAVHLFVRDTLVAHYQEEIAKINRRLRNDSTRYDPAKQRGLYEEKRQLEAAMGHEFNRTKARPEVMKKFMALNEAVHYQSPGAVARGEGKATGQVGVSHSPRSLVAAVVKFGDRLADLEMSALMRKIDDLDVDTHRRQKMLAQLRKARQSLRVQGPYVPLSRFGSYWVASKEEDGVERDVPLTTEFTEGGSLLVSGRDLFEQEELLKSLNGKKTRKGYEFKARDAQRVMDRLEQYDLLDERDYVKPGAVHYERFETSAEADERIKAIKAKDSGLEFLGHGANTREDVARSLTMIDPNFVVEVDSMLAGLGDSPAVEGMRDALYQSYLRRLPEVSSQKHWLHRKKTPGFSQDVMRALGNKAVHDAKNIARVKHGYQAWDALDEAEQALKAAGTPASMAAAVSKLAALEDYQRDWMDTTNLAFSAGMDAIEDDRLRSGIRSARRVYGKNHRALNRAILRQRRVIDQARRIDAAGAQRDADLAIGEMKAAFEDADKAIHPLAVALNGLGFATHMGISPAAALVNGSQALIMSMPAVGARFGMARASAAFWQAYRDFFSGARNQQGDLSIETNLKGPEAQALYRFRRAGGVDKTLAHDTTELSNSPALLMGPRRTLRRVMAGMFHHMERMNREVTFMAAFRLAMEDMEKDGKVATADRLNAAYEYAYRVTYETHYDYSQWNRARLMRSSLARVVFQFKQYSLGTSWLLGRNFLFAVRELKAAMKEKDKSLADVFQSEAFKTLAGILGMQALFAGALGLPIGGIMMAANLLGSVFGDADDEPWDFETWFRVWAAETFGDEAGRAISKGLFPVALNQVNPYVGAAAGAALGGRMAGVKGAVAGGVLGAALSGGPDLQNKLSMADLWVRDPDKELEGNDAALYWLSQLLGPSSQAFINLFATSKLWGDGHPERAIEKIMPMKLVADAMKAGRYEVEGVKTLKGLPMVEDVEASQALATAMGFTPLEISERYAVNRSVKNAETGLLTRRQDLLSAWAAALRSRDVEAVKAARLAAAEFSRKHPAFAIKPQDAALSARQSEKLADRAVGGVVLSRRSVREGVPGAAGWNVGD